VTVPANSPQREEPVEETPPLLGAWRNVYLAVAGWLLFLILLFYAFTRGFAP
jgi:hypothetical protein